MNFFRTKSLSSLSGNCQQQNLKKNLGALDMVLLGVGCIVGTGIFVFTGVVAAKYAGPGIIISLLLSAIACAFCALCYSEMASTVPVAGSSYTYAYTTMGEVFAWLVGWSLVLEYSLAASLVAAGWSAYTVGLFKSAGFEIPKAFTAVAADGGMVDVPAMLILLFLSVLLVRGTKESATINKILVGVKLTAVFIFLFLAGPKVNPVNWSPFLPFGFSGVMTGAATIFLAYIGFDCVATAAEECKRPNRDLPIGIIGSLIVCAILYMLVAAVLTGVIPYQELNNAEPVAFALRQIGYNIGSALVGTGAIAGLTTVLMAVMYGQTRVFFAMSRDGLIPASICKVHPKYGTPHIITIVSGISVAVIAGLTPVDILAELVNIGTLLAFLTTAIGVLILRKIAPGAHRPFRCPAVNFVAPAAILCCVYLMYSLPIQTWIRYSIWTAVGLVIYFGYGYRHSTLGQTEKDSAKEETYLIRG
ncbi:amino acid permease [Sporomusa acidovorans]|uniref:Amino acid permease YhdG n=1 Tax=Sporomusa acidovorans (strain ATCC 49682 / DSM 3132 / Mol) TaxID=1123286 RepID=A0ABZ3IYE2_SPOA4|nr:amino acid permease [Sporomusa acidovorans]OZC16827.1 putative amino acid permease YhdG [Sporomusa acidovorans DSM 3132]SDF23610.1 amino acid/polyamine/organocation transporter, APC superfamily [Sporomusa acidovorans]